MSKVMMITKKPECDICKEIASVYGRIREGGLPIQRESWIFMCIFCWYAVGVGELGADDGQLLITPDDIPFLKHAGVCKGTLFFSID